jgi:hypothetical protein
LYELESGSVDGFPVCPGGHIARLGSDLFIGHHPQFQVVELLKKLVKLDGGFLGHFAKYDQKFPWVLHCVLLRSF